jgi:hypothetical protein
VPALPFSGRRWQEWPLDGSSDDGRDIHGGVASPLIKGDDLL